MFEALNFVCNHFWQDQAHPELVSLGQQLNAAGFGADEVADALQWLRGLTLASSCEAAPSSGLAALAASGSALPATGLRAYTRREQHRLGVDSMGFIHRLECMGALPMRLRELVIDRAVAVGASGLTAAQLKLVVLLVYRSLGYQPGLLIMDELSSDHRERVCH